MSSPSMASTTSLKKTQKLLSCAHLRAAMVRRKSTPINGWNNRQLDRRVDLEFPKIEVRFQNLTVESFVHVGSRALSTIPNFIFNMTEALLRQLRLYSGKRSKLTILDDVSGIIRPSRFDIVIGSSELRKNNVLVGSCWSPWKSFTEF